MDDDCWNDERGLCKDCAPDLQEEFSSIQTQAAIDDAREKAATVDYVSADKFKQTIVGACPHCGAKVSGGKFCPECGQPLSAEKFCVNCGAKLKAEAEYEVFRQRQDKDYLSDFDREIKRIEGKKP